MLPREEYLKAVKRKLPYLKIFAKWRAIIDTVYLDHSVSSVVDHSNWMEFYPNAVEEISKDLLAEKGPGVKMNVYVDNVHDLVTRRSITGILVMLNIMST
jgi:hypothetical protein